MNREIKFRAWNGKKMRYKVNINDGKCVRYGYQWFNEGNDIYESTPMQYTGLKDKNGKEIYEGDILKWGVNVYYLKHEGAMYGYYKGLDDGPVHFGWLQRGSEFEVIGNIHDNPELIK